MICRPDRSGWRRVGLVLAAALLAGPAGAGGGPGDAALREALVALGRGDGIAAEVALRRAERAGLPRAALAARMGEAHLVQGQLSAAREWLGPGAFTPAEAAHGWRMLGRLEMAERNLPAAGRAFDQALRLAPRDDRLWVDIARLRYSGGEQVEAIAAVDQALAIAPDNPRALELRGLMVRDSFGLAAALPWFEAGLAQRPDDLPLLGEYAATLGELGRARDMLVVTRRMLALQNRHPRALYLQAVLAARAGDVPLARHLLALGGPGLLDMPAALLLSGVLELETGNAHVAVGLLDRLVRAQPENAPARLLLARALGAAGNPAGLIARFGAEAGTPGASPYLRTLVARAHETRGQRDLAAPLLEAATRPAAAPLQLLEHAPGTGLAAASIARVRLLAATGDLAAATREAEAAVAARPGALVTRTLAGDVAFLRGDLARAQDHYQAAAAVRRTDPLLLRLVAVAVRSGQGEPARQLIAAARNGWPRQPLPLRLQAGMAMATGDWPGAIAPLGQLAAQSGARDAALQADLSLAASRGGQWGPARAAAATALQLQPLSATAALAYGQSLSGPPVERVQALAWLERAEVAGGASSIATEARRRLGAASRSAR
ncbi:tetratricopeptide repeat protein [Novosphingobium piscinae]|uniref:Tetratricopeptide repeat protein n=1 Tax=Novosphingobium piscinae TaxID=1507448 RepID=A0A7X1FYB8_9SPHN|nr:tetratricopeptide repeat protein [Novosphingobium piscinae]MBC2668552.1 hypothetical protein [Novosphingobium piscinae]